MIPESLLPDTNGTLQKGTHTAHKEEGGHDFRGDQLQIPGADVRTDDDRDGDGGTDAEEHLLNKTSTEVTVNGYRKA